LIAKICHVTIKGLDRGRGHAYKYSKLIFVSLANVTFSKAERDFLDKNEACRIATCHDAVPHVVPVSYVFEDDTFYIATDYETRKYENIKHNKTVALVVDVYSSVNNKAVCVQGTAEIVERGQEFARLYKMFYERFEWVRQDAWAEGEAPFVKVSPTNKVSWGMS
jgi:nitroimidazol reductase NimA-like FMN-containing flavoprotein (pyridoxamine 5'-phosphate oxidase superfamily)